MERACRIPVQSEIAIYSLSKDNFFPIWGRLVLIVLPFVASCATLVDKDRVARTIVTAPVVETEEARSPDFGLVGRVSVKGGKESFSGGVQWTHSGSRDEILLLTPIGQTLAQIQRSPEGVYLTTPGQQSYYAADVESLTEQVLGWRLPLKGLQYWVQSMYSPATAAAIDLDMQGKVVSIRQDGWEIEYSSYVPASATQTAQGQFERPRLLLLKRNDLQIKLVIDAWSMDTWNAL